MLGASFLGSRGHAPFSSWLGSYSAMTSIYSIAVVLLTYEMSRRIANATWIQLLFSAFLPIAIMAFHNSVQQVITVQLVLMLGLLAAVSVPFCLEMLSGSEDRATTWGRFTKIRQASEEEVIAEFLKAEFYQPEFDLYRRSVSAVVFEGDIHDEGQNAIRKALLYRRRGRLWRELPDDTTWWEIQLEPSDLTRIRAFPRKQWRKFAEGDFYLTTMIERIRSYVESSDRSWFSKKMRSVTADLQANSISNSVLLIGLDDLGPLTIIEGNHRMAAAMLSSSETVTQKFRFYCGLSPSMTTCCWYRTDLRSLTRYAHNTIRYLLRDRDYVVQRILRDEMYESGIR